jgi:hypothetical protein
MGRATKVQGKYVVTVEREGRYVTYVVGEEEEDYSSEQKALAAHATKVAMEQL